METATAATAQMIAELSRDKFAEPNARARAALHTLLTFINAECGFIYTLQTDGLEMAAREGALPPPQDLDTLVSAYLDAEIDGCEEETISFSSRDGSFGRSTRSVGRAPTARTLRRCP